MIALTYFPLPRPISPRGVVVGEANLISNPSRQGPSEVEFNNKARKETGALGGLIRVEKLADMDYSVLDRVDSSVKDQRR